MSDEREDDTPKTTPDIPPEAPEPEDPDVIKIKVSRKVTKLSLEFEDESIGKSGKYTLREMMGSKKDEWLNFVTNRVKLEKGQAVGMKDYKGMEAKLISYCLYNDDGRLVDEKTIDKWPSSTKTQLFRMCQKMNALDEEGEKEAKNS